MLSPHLAELDMGGDCYSCGVAIMDHKSKAKSTSSALQEISNGPYSVNKPPGWKQRL